MTVISQEDGPSRGIGGLVKRLRLGAYGSGVGAVVVAVGILLIGLGWNGMAGGGGEVNGVPNLNAQLPWLVSGGILGLALVVFGSAIVVAHNARVDRARLEAKLDDLTAALEHSAQASRDAAETYRPAPRAAEPTERTAAPAKRTASKRTTASPRR